MPYNITYVEQFLYKKYFLVSHTYKKTILPISPRVGCILNWKKMKELSRKMYHTYLWFFWRSWALTIYFLAAHFIYLTSKINISYYHSNERCVRAFSLFFLSFSHILFREKSDYVTDMPNMILLKKKRISTNMI